MPENAQFCNKCGEGVQGSPKPKKKFPVLMVSVLLLFIGLGVGLVYFLGNPSSTQNPSNTSSQITGPAPDERVSEYYVNFPFEDEDTWSEDTSPADERDASVEDESIAGNEEHNNFTNEINKMMKGEWFDYSTYLYMFDSGGTVYIEDSRPHVRGYRTIKWYALDGQLILINSNDVLTLNVEFTHGDSLYPRAVLSDSETGEEMFILLKRSAREEPVSVTNEREWLNDPDRISAIASAANDESTIKQLVAKQYNSTNVSVRSINDKEAQVAYAVTYGQSLTWEYVTVYKRNGEWGF